MQYAELHCKTNFSFLEGASHAAELVERAAKLGYAALAITDRNTLAGVVRAHCAAKDIQLPLIIGCELVTTNTPPMVVWPTNRAAYGRLSRLITLGRRRAPKGHCELSFEDLAEHAEGLLAGVITYDRSYYASMKTASSVPTPPPRAARPANPRHASVDDHVFLKRFRELFADRGYLLISQHRSGNDAQQLQQLIRYSHSSGLPLLATGGVFYHAPSRMPLHDVLTAIRHGVSVAEAGYRLLPNAQRHLRSLEELSALFQEHPEALHRTLEVAERCTFSLDELRYEYPEELAPAGLTPFAYLQQLTWKGAAKRYPTGIPTKVHQLLKHELSLIEQLHYEAYFLTVWDLVRFARRRGILCQGRGSAANSAVCYCLGITSVDPAHMDVLFERFVSRERDEAPDIDVDFEHERREEVLQYLYRKYGRERAGMTAVVITYRVRSAIRDVGKALGFSLDRIDALAKQVEGHHSEPQLAERCDQVGIDPASDVAQKLIHLVNELIGFPRHLSQHVGGMVMTRGPLCELTPIENAAMQDRTVIQWDKDDLDELGILKVDCLALGMLTAIHRCFDFVAQHYHRPLTLATIPANDQRVYTMICCADTMGVFQIESRAQMSMLPRLKPRCYYDLVIEVAIVRPGPIQGQMVHPYLRRRSGQEPVTYPNKSVQGVLKKTLGVPIFQEQAMRLAVVAAGFTPGEADQLRRAMGAWRRPGIIDRFRRRLLEGMQNSGLSREFAEQLFQQIRGFGEYGFPESHAASFALLVYVSAWLKFHYPAAYTAALLNSQPMGFYAPSQLVRDARQHGVPVLPVDVNHSDWDCTLEPIPHPTSANQQTEGSENAPSSRECKALRLGFRILSGVARESITTLCRERAASGPFLCLESFARRTSLSPSAISRLAAADVFRSVDQNRRTALWHTLSDDHAHRQHPLFAESDTAEKDSACLPTMTSEEEVFADYRTAGLSLRAHPLSFHRDTLDGLHVTTAAQLSRLPHRRPVTVAGLVLLRQRPSTAKGITFVTLEDETGTINLVVHQRTWQRFYQVARRSPAWLAKGHVERKDAVIHVVVQYLQDLADQIQTVAISSRDFR
jgi:error-prone DNA polymerase